MKPIQVTGLAPPEEPLSPAGDSGAESPSSRLAERSMAERLVVWLTARAMALDAIGGSLRAKLVVPAASFLVALIAAADFAMGSEITLRFFYCIPLVLLVAARHTRSAVVMAVVCDVCWIVGDRLAGARYSSTAVPIINWLITLAVYLLVIWLLAGLLNLHREMEERVRERSEALTAEIAERSRLEREIINLSDKERWSLGHDLHDGLGQHFTASAMAAQSLARDLEDDRHQAANDAYRLVRMIEDGIGQTRRLAKGLLLVTVEGDDFGDALRDMVRNTSENFHVACNLQLAGETAGLDANVATHLFRIAQEAVRNATRHGKPTRVEVSVSGDKTGIFIAVRDDGIGLPPDARGGQGMGLRIMEHRAKVIGAAFGIRRLPHGGTLMECRWPRRTQPT